MGKVIILALGLLLVLAILATGALAALPPPQPTATELARDYAEAARIERAAELDATWAPVRAAVLNIALVVAVFGGLAAAGAWGSLALARFRRERMPRRDGLVPVLAADLGTVGPQALGAWHGARQLAAAHGPVPHTLTYSPHASYAPRVDYRAHPLGAAVPPAPELPAAASELPSFAQLLDRGTVGPGRPMLLGFDRETGAPISGSWLDLYSTAVGGLSGTGKSWTAAFLACQAALQGSRLLILDPHAESAESLSARLAPMRARFVCDPATTPAAMLAAVRLAASELERRKGGYTRGTAPIVVVADEFAALQRGELAEPLAALIEALGQEGRKLDLFGMVCSQVWSAERAGGTPLRDSLASAYIHRLRPAQARMLSGLTSAELPTDLFTLGPGVAYLVTTGGELRPVVIPHMSPDDIARVAAMVGAAAPSAAPSAPRPMGFRPEGRAEGRTEGASAALLPRRQDGPEWTPEEAAIVAALARGKKPGKLAEELSGEKGGRKYQAAAEKIAAVIERLAARKGGK